INFELHPVTEVDDSNKVLRISGSVAFTAVQHGIPKIVKECLVKYPDIILYKCANLSNRDESYLPLEVITQRQEKVYNVIWKSFDHKLFKCNMSYNGTRKKMLNAAAFKKKLQSIPELRKSFMYRGEIDVGLVVARNIDNTDHTGMIKRRVVCGTGFLKLKLSMKWIAQSIFKMIKGDIAAWASKPPVEKAIIYFLSPNIVEEMHIGHLRSTVIGETLARVLEYSGVEVIQRFHEGTIWTLRHGKERDESNEYVNYQPGPLITTDQLVTDLDNYDIVFHIGDLPYANGYLLQWDQFTAQVQAISSVKPYMMKSRNHEHDFPNFGSFYNTPNSGGNVVYLLRACTMFQQITKPKSDYGMFHFCIANSEHDWREGSE
ncbi:nucleotide pyrophosphatase/phosphodiesterase-like protein, partial [Tanacetum coccineum]